MSEYIVDGAEPNNTVLKSITPNGYEHEKWLPVREEIVRCRDCVHFEKTVQFGICHRSEFLPMWAELNGFCAWAERKEGGE